MLRNSSLISRVTGDSLRWRNNWNKIWALGERRSSKNGVKTRHVPSMILHKRWSLSSKNSPVLHPIAFSLSSLETTGRLMELDARDGKLRVLYGTRLTTLINEVRQLSSLGYEIPPKISKCVDVGKKFYQYSVELQAVGDTNDFIEATRLTDLACPFLQYDRFWDDSLSTTDDARFGEEFRTSSQRSQSLS